MCRTYLVDQPSPVKIQPPSFLLRFLAAVNCTACFTQQPHSTPRIGPRLALSLLHLLAAEFVQHVLGAFLQAAGGVG